MQPSSVCLTRPALSTALSSSVEKSTPARVTSSSCCSKFSALHESAAYKRAEEEALRQLLELQAKFEEQGRSVEDLQRTVVALRTAQELLFEREKEEKEWQPKLRALSLFPRRGYEACVLR